jgi:hypothetical protein
MADQILNSGSSSNPLSPLNKLPTKQIDARIRQVADSGPVEQGEQTGGFNPAYTHLSHLPLLSLYSDAQTNIMVRQQAGKEQRVRHMDANDPDKLLTGGEKAFLNSVGHLTGASSAVGVKRWERRLVGAGLVTKDNLMQQTQLVVFTRWTVPNAQGTPWFVDVLDFTMSNYGMTNNSVKLIPGLRPSNNKKDGKVTLKLLGTEAKAIKSQKVWSKRYSKELCNAITFVNDEGQEVAMEIVARVQRNCSVHEGREVQARFKKGWKVPLLQ